MKAIETHYIASTNYRPQRIGASDLDGNRIVISWPNADTTEAAFRVAAEALRDKMGWSGALLGGATKRGYTFVFSPRGTSILDALETLREAVAPLIEGKRDGVTMGRISIADDNASTAIEQAS